MTGSPRRSSRARTLDRKGFLPLFGLLSLSWFLARVIPKPSRAAYPCQRAAFPVASAFVVWVVGLLSSALVGAQAKRTWLESRRIMAASLALATLFLVVLTFTLEGSRVAAAIYRAKEQILPGESLVMSGLSTERSSTVAPAAVVGAVKSTAAHAEEIDSLEIAAMVDEAIRRSGGLESILSDGDTVVLKPNLISSHDFTAAGELLDPEANGIVTDYRVIQAVVNEVRELNPTGAVIVMEGSGVGTTSVNVPIVRWDLVTGIDSLIYLEEACGDWWDTTSVYLQGVSLPEGKALYQAAENRYWLNKLYYTADVLISLPVLKNHMATGVTGAVKNVGIGATPPTIYGMGPGTPYPYQRSPGINHGVTGTQRRSLHQWIHDFYMCRPVDFAVMDGLQGIENGPVCDQYLNGSQHISDDQMNARMILAGSDPIALDAVAALLCGHDPQAVRHLVRLNNDTLGCCDPRLIRVNGIQVSDEKQAYQIADSGVLSQYSDFTPPVFAVDQCYVQGSELHFHLTADEEVSKVEVALDGEVLNQIQLEPFDHFSFDLDTFEVDETTEIVVYAYDTYLNCSSQTVDMGGATAVESGEDVTIRLSVGPTPSKNETGIIYSLREATDVSLAVYNVAGRRVSALVDGRQPAGVHQTAWNSSGLAAGVYFVRLQAGGEIVSRKVLKIE